MVTALRITKINIVLETIDEDKLYDLFPLMDKSDKSMIFPTNLWGKLVVYSEEGDIEGCYKNHICNHLAEEDDYYYGLCLIVREDKYGNVKSLTKRDVTKIMKRCYEALF